MKYHVHQLCLAFASGHCVRVCLMKFLPAASNTPWALWASAVALRSLTLLAEAGHLQSIAIYS